MRSMLKYEIAEHQSRGTMYPNLRIQLWKAGIRQNRLAKMLDMDETVLSRIVNGFRQPSPDFRKKISALLNSDEAWLFQALENAPLANDGRRICRDPRSPLEHRRRD